MLFTGVYEADGARYTVYRLVTQSVTRLDIMEEGADFQIDADKTYYGYWKKKSYVAQFGDLELYHKFNELQDILRHSKGEMENSTDWVNGAIHSVFTKVVKEGVHMMERIVNGRDNYSEFHLLGTSYVETCTSEDFDMELEPANFVQYEQVKLEAPVKLDKITTPIVQLETLVRNFDLSWAKKVDYRIITSEKEAREHIAFLASLKGKDRGDMPNGFDFETTGTTFNCYESDKVVGLVVNYKRNQSVYFPFAHEEVDWNLPWDVFEDLLEALKGQAQCAHFKKFERKVLMSVGHRYFPIRDDSMIASFLNEPTMQKGVHALKNLAADLTGWQFVELEDIFNNKSQIDFSKIKDPEIARIYACPDADSCCKVLSNEKLKMPKSLYGIYDLECELADLKAEQEYWGFRINYEKIVYDAQNCNEILANLSRIFHEMTKTDVDLNSPAALADLLYNKLKCPVLVRTKTHQPSTGAKARKKLAREVLPEPSDFVKSNITDAQGNVIIKADDLNKAKYPPIIVLNAYRDYAKLSQAFYSRFLNAKYKDRYFSWVNQHGADTGRQSSPMHQLPKKIKACILADSEDHVLVDADYSQVELRILASAAGERDLVEEMKDSSKDIHRIIANKISGVPMHMISSEMRQGFKQTNFGVVYLISGRGLAEQRFGVGCSKDKIRECEDSIMDFYKTFKRIRVFNEKSRRTVLEKGEAYTYFNRVRKFPEMTNSGITTERRESIIRQATNMPIQGTAADVMKMAEVELNRWIIKHGWDELVETPQGKFPYVRVMLSAHDEVLISMHKSIARNVPLVYRMIKECMEIQIEDWAPLFTSTCIIDNWEEGKADEYAVPIELRDKIIEEGSLRLTSDNLKKEMLDILQAFREKELITFIEDLITEVNSMDPKIVAKAVDDPVLTHSMIDRFGPKKAWLAKNGSLDQEGLILYSVKSYFEQRDKLLSPELSVEEPVEIQEETAVDPFDIEETIKEVMELSESIYDFDPDGNLIGVDGQVVEEEPEEYDVFSDADLEFFSKLEDDKEFIVIEAFNMAIVDTDGLSRSDLQELLNILYAFHDDNGLCEFYLLYNGNMLDTTIRYEKFDKETIIDWVDKRRMVRENV